jgi:apolipoprotein D and lipocalin family protein
MNRLKLILGVVLMALSFSACSSAPTLPTVPQVDLQRYQGDWYVIAAIPSYPERKAYNAVESYSLQPDGKIHTNFRFRKGSFEAPVKTMHPVGTVRPGTGQAVWGMQFIWPIKAEYLICYLDPDYQTVIVGRSKRDYVWIMARTPTLPDATYKSLVDRVAAFGYDVSKLRKVPQRWPEQ